MSTKYELLGNAILVRKPQPEAAEQRATPEQWDRLYRDVVERDTSIEPDEVFQQLYESDR